MSITVAIVGHVERLSQVTQLAARLAPASVFVDDGSLGEWPNHRRALAAAATSAESHVLVIQDDAQPVPLLLHHVRQAIEQRPEDLISFYVGQARPRARAVSSAVTTARETGASWLSAERLLWGVCFALPVAAIPSLIPAADQYDCPTDRRIGKAWAATQQRPVLYTWPSLVDHADGEQLTTDHPVRQPGRVAHEVAIPTWSPVVVEIQ